MLLTHNFKKFTGTDFLKTSRFLRVIQLQLPFQIFPGARVEKVFMHFEFKEVWRTLPA